ncbi:unnamed protein product [Scytosiphon promiscuus]
MVGGVNLLLSPGPFDLFSKTGMLAPDGRSKAFSGDADGYGRGEGCGAVVLKRLEDATNDGDRVLAVIKGSAVGHNGRSATLTAPNGTSQRATIAAALREAGPSTVSLLPWQVSYVEAHGTGTALGDPVEFGALRAVYGVERSAETPLVIGAVKSNIGHLEGAAGMSGLIKTILVLAHGSAPPNLHASDVNPRIDLSSLPALLPSAGEPTRLSQRRPCSPAPSAEQRQQQEREDERQQQLSHTAGPSAPPTPFLGGVSSFGFGGTNAHVVLEGKPGAFGGGVAAASRDKGMATCAPLPGVAFLFTGQGSQYPGMGRELYESYGEFRDVVDACDEELADVLPRRLVSVLYGDEEDAAKLLATTRYAQPALFAVECATAAALRAAGVVPSAVMGHSLGELAAACVAGVMTLREGVRLVAERGRLMDDVCAASGGGGGEDDADGPECMAAVRATETKTSAAVALLGGGRVSIAAVNGPDSISASEGPARVEDNDLSPPGSATATGKKLGRGVNPSGFSTRDMSWLAGAKSLVSGGDGGAAALDGSQSTGSVSPSSESDGGERGTHRSDSGTSTAGGLSDDGPLAYPSSQCGKATNGARAVLTNGPIATSGAAATGGDRLESNGNLDLPADRFRVLQGVSRAFHSPAMALAASGTEAAARKVSLRDPSVPLASNVTGMLARQGELTDPAYWARHVLGCVRFHDAGRPLSEGITTFVEVGPTALLCGMGRRALKTAASTTSSAAKVGTGHPGVSRERASLRWIAAMSSEDRSPAKSGLGHVVGAVRGVHYRRKAYPWSDPAAPPAGTAAFGSRSRPLPEASAPVAARLDVGGDGGRDRPPLRLLETEWVCVEDDLSAPSVWLLAGRTDESYAAISDAVSGVGGDGDAAEAGECLAHLLTLGPSAAGGETAAAANRSLARCKERCTITVSIDPPHRWVVDCCEVASART